MRWYYNDYSSGGSDDTRRPYVASTTSRGRATEIASSSAKFKVESMPLVCPLLIAALVRRVMLVVY